MAKEMEAGNLPGQVQETKGALEMAEKFFAPIFMPVKDLAQVPLPSCLLLTKELSPVEDSREDLSHLI